MGFLFVCLSVYLFCGYVFGDFFGGLFLFLCEYGWQLIDQALNMTRGIVFGGVFNSYFNCFLSD